MAHSNPITLSTTTTQVEVTLLSAAGDDCTMLAAPLDATSDAKQLCLNHLCWLMWMAVERGLRRPVTTDYADWLRWQAMEIGYAGWLRKLVTLAGYGDWLR